MRVQALDQMPPRAFEARPSPTDASASQAVQNFVNIIGSDDSIFRVDQLDAGAAPMPSEKGSCTYVGDILLGFKDSGPARDRKLHFTMLEKMRELLKEAGSQEFLTAMLYLTGPSREDSKQEGLALRLRLQATGDSLEQAGLRWSLGLAHVQQALLFTSRHLRQHLSQS